MFKETEFSTVNDFEESSFYISTLSYAHTSFFLISSEQQCPIQQSIQQQSIQQRSIFDEIRVESSSLDIVFNASHNTNSQQSNSQQSNPQQSS
jgi:hypothetical protein